jgi:hypothetical protein
VNQIVRDYDEIKHVVERIEEEWSEPWDMDASPNWEGLPTVNILVDKLRKELLTHGGATAEQLIDANEILYYYLDAEVLPDMWQYSFAQCLVSMLMDFDEPYIPTNPKERLHRSNILRRLEGECAAVLMSDLARIREANVTSLTPLARLGKSHSAQQSQRAKKPRSPLTGIIESLVRQYPEESAKELWRHFYAALDEEGLNPDAIEQSDQRRWRYEYDFGDEGRKTITYGHFANTVSQLKSE